VRRGLGVTGGGRERVGGGREEVEKGVEGGWDKSDGRRSEWVALDSCLVGRFFLVWDRGLLGTVRG